MRTRISSKGQIVVPSELRELDKLVPGQQFTVERLEPGTYLLRRISQTGHGLVQWLRDCPEDDWFEAMPSESTDQL
ncbi:MAG: AbrB/MazE/SpoVT family DNA-binding domain-containing protein [Candidatus Eremiobacteraeota bacterium]|nr:AbrB/MazE/SpoVT family DNA-binding domain-containing protein [Candidatus Eremiobacteraeota bacterium]MCW5871329.1 AbrB/MazE/SpoVT family DNA-binding domain-containing protein [Candidatus Eremiobacteraeota bacterium]